MLGDEVNFIWRKGHRRNECAKPVAMDREWQVNMLPMYSVTITMRDGTVTLELKHAAELAALLTFDTAITYPGNTITLTHEGVELRRRQVPSSQLQQREMA